MARAYCIRSSCPLTQALNEAFGRGFMRQLCDSSISEAQATRLESLSAILILTSLVTTLRVVMQFPALRAGKFQEFAGPRESIWLAQGGANLLLALLQAPWVDNLGARSAQTAFQRRALERELAILRIAATVLMPLRTRAAPASQPIDNAHFARRT